MLLFMLICVTTVLIVLKIFYNTFLSNNNLPGPWSLPVFGYLPFLDQKFPFVTLAKLAEKFGPIYRIQLGNVNSVIVSDVKLIKRILLKTEASGRPPLLLFKTVSKGQGIIFTNGDTWKKNLKFTVDAFNTQGASKFSTNKKLLEQLLIKEAEDFVNTVGDEKSVNVLEEIQSIVASIISKLFFGESFSKNDKSWQDILSWLDEATQIIMSAKAVNFLPFLRFIPPFSQHVSFLSDYSYVNIFNNFKKIINDSGELKSKIPSLMNIFQSKKLGTDNDFCRILIDVLGAGIETTTHALTWLLLRLAKDPTLQAKITKEISTVLRGKTPTLEDLSQLPLLKATICESARTRSITPISVPHYALQDIQIDGFAIPKGSTIFPLIYAVHMNPQLWDEPHEFKPERFLNSHQEYEKNENLISFLFGRRMCPGKQLATMTIYFVAVVLLQHFQILGDNIDLEPVYGGVTLAPKPQKIVLKKI